MWIVIKWEDGKQTDEMVGPFEWHGDAHSFCEMKRVLKSEAWATRSVEAPPAAGWSAAWDEVKAAMGLEV